MQDKTDSVLTSFFLSLESSEKNHLTEIIKKINLHNLSDLAKTAALLEIPDHLVFMAEKISRWAGENRDPLLEWLILGICREIERGHLCITAEEIDKDWQELWQQIPESGVKTDLAQSYKNIFSDQQKIGRLIAKHPSIFAVSEDNNFPSAPFLSAGKNIYTHKNRALETEFIKLLLEERNTVLKPPGKKQLEEILTKVTRASGKTIPGEKQLQAVKQAFNRKILIVTGGPGTGKTTTAVNILRAFLYREKNDHKSIRFGLAAPTGRAAGRITESLRRVLDISNEVDLKLSGLKASTLHKLLGLGFTSPLPGYNRVNRLPFDLVLVDEASMIGLELMVMLLRALADDAVLVLLGDHDQLPSVEAGALLADLIPADGEKQNALGGQIICLSDSHRTESKQILDAAAAVRSGDYSRFSEILGKGSEESVTVQNNFPRNWHDLIPRDLSSLCRLDAGADDIGKHTEKLDKAFAVYNSCIILCTSRLGNAGVKFINNNIRSNFPRERFFPGQPVLITRNDYASGLFNGDRGIIWQFNDPGGKNPPRLFCVFEGLADEYEIGSAKKNIPHFRIIAPERMPEYELAWAMTVHKSQGSEFDIVHVVISPDAPRLLSREILYTAITRARKKVIIYGNNEDIKKALNSRVIRRSGIREALN
ncbi:MAG: exodeoxyribonuclease V subunit alpha [Spirochaetes bacterium GWF1_41_5]|nr:MAG: exodeoxyribonuclease V subunit alpha [Spirochaetes bacterium GWF1_41_5]